MSSPVSTPQSQGYRTPPETREGVVLRFAGDSGDGMVLAGLQFTAASLHAGNDVHALPFFPSEIRAPAGTAAAVSAFQIHFGRHPVHTPGDRLDALVAMNAAGLKLHLPDLLPGGLLLINSDAFDAAELERAGYKSDPLADGSLSGYRVLAFPADRLNREAVAPVKLLSPREADRSRNLFALGLACWMFDRPCEPILQWIRAKFAKNPAIVDANTRTLKAGYHFGETTGQAPAQLRVEKAVLRPGQYRRVTGNEALSLGLAAAAQKAKRPLVFAGFPMIPAGDLQQHFFDLQRLGVRAVQAEDEMAAIGMALGASFAGGIGVTVTSGPGMCLNAETIGLAVISELPLVVVNVQRVGPGGGIPSQSDQGDLLQALFGRNGESPVVVLSPTSPADSFTTAAEAVRLAARAMTPVIILTEISLCHGSEPWLIPTLADLPDIVAPQIKNPKHGEPFARNTHLARPWIVPGTPGGEHRLGALEKQDITGHFSADPTNHERMVRLRADKIAKLAEELPPVEVIGPLQGDLLILGWGSTAGPIRAAVEQCQARSLRVAGGVLKSLNPLPRDLGEVMARYRRVLIAELNSGQLSLLIRGKYLIDAVGLNKTRGRPFEVGELIQEIEMYL